MDESSRGDTLLSREKVSVVVENESESVALIQEFWKAMPHGTLIRNISDWSQELTAGDRTKLIHVYNREKKRREMTVLFQGNNQMLSQEAMGWLAGKGFIT